MKLLIQRVSEASVSIEGTCVGEIGAGCVVLVGCRFDDKTDDSTFLADKFSSLRIFEDDAGRMNRSIKDTGGRVLLISQFTLYADTRKGNRPGFTLAGDPADAETRFNEFVEAMRAHLGPDHVETGRFGAKMRVNLVNEGPVTIALSSDDRPWHAPLR